MNLSRYFSILLIVSISLLYNFNAKGQVLNIGKRDFTGDSSKYMMASFDFSFQVDNRNVVPDEKASFLGVESGLDMTYVGEKNSYLLLGQLNHYRATGDPVISTGFAHFRINLERKRVLSYELFLQELFDASRNLDHRALAGGGLKYRFVDVQKLQANLGVGLMYENEKWETLSNENEHIINNMWKSTNYVRFNVVASDNTDFSFATYYQVGYDNDDALWRHRISVHLMLEIAMGEHFGFVVQGGYSHENTTILPGINKSIYSFMNGLRVNF